MLLNLTCLVANMSDSFVTPWAAILLCPWGLASKNNGKWPELPFLSPGDFPDPGIKSESPAKQADFFYHQATREAQTLPENLQKSQCPSPVMLECLQALIRQQHLKKKSTSDSNVQE